MRFVNALTEPELNNVITTLGAIKGARLQEVLTTDSDVCLGLYAGGALAWLWIDLNATKPMLLPWSELPLKLRWTKSPLHLFLRAHFVNRTLADVRVAGDRGRVVQIHFGNPEDEGEPTLEVRLFPHLRNVIARAGTKQIAWQKPRPLTEAGDDSRAHGPPRNLETLREEWLTARRGGTPKQKVEADPLARTRERLNKRLKALDKVNEELARKREMPWKDVGTWLKANQSLDVPTEFEPFVDRRRKLAGNIETCFTKARELEVKTEGTETRLRVLENEIADLRARLANPSAKLTDDVPEPKASPLAKDSAQGRTLKLEDGVIVVAGKSAADNLKLLRRARAWDLWIHLRDYPSSHAILFRNKNQRITDETLRRVAAWFIKMTLGQKAERLTGARFEILIAECRFVRPIKGDKLGRVTFRDERTLIYRQS